MTLLTKSCLHIKFTLGDKLQILLVRPCDSKIAFCATLWGELGVTYFERKFQEEGGRPRPPKNFGVRVPGLSRGVVCVILRLAVLIQYRRVTHRETDGHTMMAITRASLAPRG